MAFLSVMALFAIANLLLKFRRNSLATDGRAAWYTVVGALAAVTLAFVATIVKQPQIIPIFLLFFFGVFGLIAVQLTRTSIFVFLLNEFDSLLPATQRDFIWIKNTLVRLMRYLESQPILLLAKKLNIHWLSKAVRYCRDNESSRVIRIVHIASDLDAVPGDFAELVRVLNASYPRYRIDATVIEGEV